MLPSLPWEKIVTVGVYMLGLCSELFGLYRMAHRHLAQEQGSSALTLWFSALRRGNEARGATRKIPDPDAEEQVNLYALQGLAFVGLGFVLQAAVGVYSLMTSP